MLFEKPFCITIFLLITLTVVTSTSSQTNDENNLKISGAFMGAINYINQEDQSDVDKKRQQFDLALNLDFEYAIRPNVRGTIQLQTGAGEGSLGFAGPGVSVTDLNLEIDLLPTLTLALGSFDTPFCLETQYLTNNGDGFSNALLLNSLFYSAFAGTNVGTLNTLGIQGIYSSKIGKLILAITNGTDETAINPDGNFEWVVSGCTKALRTGLTLAASFISSKDSSQSGSSGTGSKYQGWIIDSRYDLTPDFFIHGYYGQFDYDDFNPSTSDKVSAWKAEARYGRGKWYIASRISSWSPDRLSENFASSSMERPNPGLGVVQKNTAIRSDQTITRLQATWGWQLHEDLLLKCEYFRDGYGASNFSNGFYTQGIMIALNARF